MAKKAELPAEPTVTFWGAARTVTGSMHQRRRLRTDAAAGLRPVPGPPRREPPPQPDVPLPPARHRRGAAQPRPHRPLRQPAQPGQAGLPRADLLHAGDARPGRGHARRRRQDPRGRRGLSQSQTRARASRRSSRCTMAGTSTARCCSCKAVPYDTPVNVGRGLEATFVDAGHLLGSAMISLRMDGPERRAASDLHRRPGPAGLPILRDPSPVPPADLLISECTYGGHTHEPVEETAERLGEVVRRTAERGGKLIIPAFSVGRTQTIVYFLHQLMQRRPPAGPAHLRGQSDGGAGHRGVPRPSGVLQRRDAAAAAGACPTCSANSRSTTSRRCTRASP